ncbi:hypothetical protein MRB53_037826 [Persea americana]|nr:hypothetical protein MRB53_037826 [Persea americana]
MSQVSFAYYEHKNDRLILKLRGSLIALIFDKTLCISSAAVSDAAAVTLVSADIDRIALGIRQFHEVWAGVVQIAIAIWLLVRLIGIAVLAPALLILVILVLGIPLANIAGNAQGDWLEAIEARIAVTSRMLGAMKGIKMTGAARSVSETVMGLREDEIKSSDRFRLYTTFVLAFSYASEALAPAFGFGTYILIAKARGTTTLTSGTAFGALTLFALLDSPMISFIDGLEELKTVVNCFRRIQEHLLEDERVDCRNMLLQGSSIETVPDQSTLAECSDISLDTFPNTSSIDKGVNHWHEEALALAKGVCAGYAADRPNVLQDLDFELPRGQVTMILGPVACGKSTLLRLLLGELSHVEGIVTTTFQHAAFCSQAPWITFGSIQQNILGAMTWDGPFYSAVTQACGLQKDFEDFPDGDQTKVGTRGSRLSGGQQMRVSLARALYARTSTVILDDVLTGLDRKTEQAVLESVFGKTGLVKRERTSVVMATNSAHQLSYADHIIVLSADGRVADQGTYDALMDRNEYIKRLSATPVEGIVTSRAPESS